jgi:hypothetical protein
VRPKDFVSLGDFKKLYSCPNKDAWIYTSYVNLGMMLYRGKSKYGIQTSS